MVVYSNSDLVHAIEVYNSVHAEWITSGTGFKMADIRSGLHITDDILQFNEIAFGLLAGSSYAKTPYGYVIKTQWAMRLISDKVADTFCLP
jgi:hypothetical protein